MSYKAGIVKAIEELKDRSGSSMISIKKHMQANMPADKKWMNAMFVGAQGKRESWRLGASEELVQVESRV